MAMTTSCITSTARDARGGRASRCVHHEIQQLLDAFTGLPAVDRDGVVLLAEDLAADVPEWW